MARFLIVYGSEEGQTNKIAHHMADLLRKDQHVVELLFGKEVPRSFVMQGYDGVMIGASIHMGRHQKYMVDFVRLFQDELADTVSAFFTVCLTAKSDAPEAKAQVAEYVQDFMDATDWRPDQAAVFAGAVPYTQYGMVKRFIMKRINADAGGDVDTSRDYEYTDWNSVDEFVESLTQAVAGKPVLADV